MNASDLTPFEQQMLGVIAAFTIDRPGGYVAGWTINTAMGGDTGIGYLYPSEGQKAIEHLIEMGLVEELEDLHYRYRLKRA